MASKKTDHIPFRQTLSLNFRAYKLLDASCPQLFLSSFVLSVISAITPYVGIYLSARIINELAGGRNPDALWNLVLLTVLSTALLMLLNAVLMRWKNSTHNTLYVKTQYIYTSKMLDMDFASLDDQHTHDLRSQIGQNERWGGWGLYKVADYFEKIIHSVVSMVSAIALTIGLFTSPVPSADGALTALNHPLFAMAIIALMLATTFLAPFFSTKGQDYWTRNAESAKFGNRGFSFYGFIMQDRSRAMDMRMYNQQRICKHYHYFSGANTFLPGSPIANAARGPMGLYKALSGAVSALFTGIVYVFVCLKAWAGAFGIGSVTQYIGSIVALSKCISALLSTLGDMRSNAFFLRTTFEFLDIENNMYQGSLTTEKRADRNYEVEFRDVSFKYPNTDTYALRHVSMKFKIGQRLAVVGMNGSGKTTFIKLLCRLYDPTQGEILLNGINIRKYKYDDYISIFSVVFQDFKLLAFPLGQNVAAGSRYDHDRVIDCLDKAGFAQRIERMPHGAETHLYKDFDIEGVEVSGGEAQKIAIARTLYKDAPFIILDEPTAALDPVAEAEIYSKFSEIVGDKTAIYISHRLSSCRFCDDIAVFDQGQMIQQGSHNQLLKAENGKYFELWHAQAQYYN